MRPAVKERQRKASACPGNLTVVVECWDEPRCSESFAAKISFGPIAQLLQRRRLFSCTDPGFRSAPPWAEFLLRLRRVKIPWRYAHQDLQISQRRHTITWCKNPGLLSAPVLWDNSSALGALRSVRNRKKFCVWIFHSRVYLVYRLAQ